MRFSMAAIMAVAMAVPLILSVLPAGVSGAKTNGTGFSNMALLRPDGDSEPAIAFDSGGTMVMTGLSWREYFTNVWKGPFGSTPTYLGPVDVSIGKSIGGGDADVDWGSTGTIHFTTLVFFFNPATRLTQLGVSEINCPNGDTSNNFANCKSQIIDTTQSDRQWITSDGPTVYISYHDSGSSTLIHVQRSDDDGATWHRVSGPIPGQGNVTGDSTFNNEQGPIVADPTTGNVYDIFAAGQPGIQKGTSANFNNIFVSRSTDKGLSWTANLVFHAPLFTALDNIFPSLAVDPASGDLYATWSDGHTVALSKSTDHGTTWSAARVVSTSAVSTTEMPWVAAYRGTVDVVYYGTTASSNLEASAVWNAYMAKSTDGGVSFATLLVSNTPNHVGVVCTGGTSCASGTRNLLDLFEVAINPTNGRAAVIYSDDTLTTYTTSTGIVKPLPQVVLAQETG